jgi:hypothetical protein
MRRTSGGTLRIVPYEAVAPEQDDTTRPAPRPATVTAAAALTAVVALLLLGYGVYLIVGGFTGEPVLRGRAETAGALFAVFGLGLALVGRGLAHLEPWARTPAMLTHLLFVGSAYRILQAGLWYWAVPVALFGAIGLVLLFVPASHKVLSRDVR